MRLMRCHSHKRKALLRKKYQIAYLVILRLNPRRKLLIVKSPFQEKKARVSGTKLRYYSLHLMKRQKGRNERL